MKKLALILCLTLSLSIVAQAAAVDYGAELALPEKAYTQKFADVDPSHWAFQNIAEMAERGVLAGYPDGKFRPANTVARSEFAKIMTVAAGLSPKPSNYSSFTDVKVTDWCSPFIETAKDYLTGYRDAGGNLIFKPEDNALREDVAVALVKLKGYDLRLADESIPRAMFKDFDGISAAAKKYVALAVENGLMSGFPDETFRAQATVSRAEAAAMLWRAYQYGSDNKVIDDSPPVIGDPSVPQTPPTPTQKTEESPVSKKYSTQTIAGASALHSMVLDGQNSIYYIASGKIAKIENGKETIIPFNSAYEKIEGDLMRMMGYQDDPGSWVSSALKSTKPIRFKNPHVKLLTYDRATDTVYATAVLYGSTGEQGDFCTLAIFDIKKPNEPVCAKYVTNFVSNPESDLNVPSNYFSIAHSGMIFFDSNGIFSANLSSGTFATYASSEKDYSAMSILNGEFSLLSLGDAAMLTQYDLASGKFQNKYLDLGGITNISAACGSNNQFYCFAGGDVYEIAPDGTVSMFIPSNEIAFKDQLPIKNVGEFAFDSGGNIVFYDTVNRLIRRINT